ncbi:hypothetical protein [Micromonospora sp. CB01531]|uniref:hypothetical protein n=1 Tax=Micromonospora sp. CB01531 TaxID=1718947 RepID=UPI00093AE61A|nr:hypothetical protein [Micromonospora sp. CB01531]OKI81664.1 hypothetical protein A6A27_16375 [Micromonospora sp. CB01531]
MNPANVRANTRSLLGLAAVSAAIAAVVTSHRPSPAAEPEPVWQPPAGYVVTDTVSLASAHTLRLWTGTSGWYVESLRSGRHEGAVGASSGSSDEYSASEILDGLVGTVPVTGARAVSVGPPGAALRADLHAGVFLLPASAVPATDESVLVTPLDDAGRPLAAETAVPIAGRG